MNAGRFVSVDKKAKKALIAVVVIVAFSLQVLAEVSAAALKDSSAKMSFSEVVKANRDTVVQVSAEISKYKKLYYDYKEPQPKRPLLGKIIDTLFQTTFLLACVVPCMAVDQVLGLVCGGQPVPRVKSQGTGFVVSPDGYILTNYHVVGYADRVIVTLRDGTTREGHVTGREVETDLAMIKVRLPQGERLSSVTFADPDAAEVGDLVVAIGNPLGLDQTVTTGVISSLSRKGPYINYLQTDAALNPGNSGGPLFLSDGTVVGVNTAMIAQAQNLGFAIPVDIVLPVVDALKQGDVHRGSIGVEVVSAEAGRPQGGGPPGLGRSPPPSCLRVSYVDPKGPAAQAGLRENDMVCAVDGTPCEKPGFLKMIASKRPGDMVTLTIARDGTRSEAKVRVAELRRRGPEEIGM